MNKFTGKFEKLHEETLFRFQQGGFLRGDYVKIKKDALNSERLQQISEALKNIIKDAIKNETVLRISYIKSPNSESFSGPVDAANVPSCNLWADCYVEYAPGMWNNVMTLPLSILEKIEVEGAEGYAPYNKNLVRPNTEEPKNPNKELKDQTKGDDENRQLPKKNTKLANTKAPKDGRSQTPFKEGVEFRKENDLIFESYLNEENSKEEEIVPKFVFTGEGVKKVSEIWEMYKPGDTAVFDAGAPGIGQIKYKITRKDDKGLYGVLLSNTIRELEP